MHFSKNDYKFNKKKKILLKITAFLNKFLCSTSYKPGEEKMWKYAKAKN